MTMTPDDMRKLRGPHSQEVFGVLIGRSGRTVRDFERGHAPIDLTTELACAAVAAGLCGYENGAIRRVENLVDAGADPAYNGTG